MNRVIAGLALLIASFAVGAFQPRTGHWWNPNESGRGFNIDIQNGVMVLAVYTYDMAGNAQWYLASGTMTNGQRNFSSTLDKYVNGQCVGCDYRAPSINGNDGTVSVSFTSEISATVTLPGGHVSTIQPLNFKYGDPPQGLLGEWIYTYDVITTFADRYDYTVVRASTANGNGTVWDDGRRAACELQILGILAGNVACFQYGASNNILNSYLYVYGVDETFSGSWLYLPTSSSFAMKGFRLKGDAGFSKAAMSDAEKTSVAAAAQASQVGPGAAPKSGVLAAALADLAVAVRATRPY